MELAAGYFLMKKQLSMPLLATISVKSIDSKTLRTVDPDLFTDPKGKKLGNSGSNYVYESTGCNNENQCTGYTLRSSMEREDTYTKTNRDHKK